MVVIMAVVWSGGSSSLLLLLLSVVGCISPKPFALFPPGLVCVVMCAPTKLLSVLALDLSPLVVALPERYADMYNKNGRIGIYTRQEREAIIARFKRKRGRRVWKKKIRYVCFVRRVVGCACCCNSTTARARISFTFFFFLR